MWTSQVYGNRDKMARTKTHRTSQNTEYYKDATDIKKYIFVFFGFFVGFFIINVQLLKGLLQKMLN